MLIPPRHGVKGVGASNVAAASGFLEEISLRDNICVQADQDWNGDCHFESISAVQVKVVSDDKKNVEETA